MAEASDRPTEKQIDIPTRRPTDDRPAGIPNAQKVDDRYKHSAARIPSDSYTILRILRTRTICICIQWYVLNVLCSHWPICLFWPWVFSRDLGCGARRGAVCTHGARLGPGRGPWPVLWASKVAQAGKQTRDFAFRLAEPRRTMEPPPKSDFCSVVAVSCLYHTVPQALKLSTWWQPRCNSSRTSSLPPFMTTADGASLCACLCHVSCRHRK